MESNNIFLTWDAYNKDLLQGFTHFLKNEEFLDMTFAAEGQFTKVHRNLVALASPYIKQLLQSAPCPHPVIFLHDVSHEVLNYIIKYIYSGEVQVPSEILESFIKTSKDLNITGIEHLPPVQKERESTNNTSVVNSDLNNIIQEIQESHVTLEDLSIMDFDDFPSAEKHIDLSSAVPNNTIYDTQTNYPNVDEDDLIKLLSDSYNDGPLKHIDYNDACLLFDDINQNTTFENNEVQLEAKRLRYPAKVSTEETHPVQHDNSINNENLPKMDLDAFISYTQNANKDLEMRCLYSVSNRGSIQLIYDHYIYSIIYQSQSGQIRRWRCVDYRQQHCGARLDTEDQIMTVRVGVHNHENHNDKILQRFKTNNIFLSEMNVKPP